MLRCYLMLALICALDVLFVLLFGGYVVLLVWLLHFVVVCFVDWLCCLFVVYLVGYCCLIVVGLRCWFFVDLYLLCLLFVAFLLRDLLLFGYSVMVAFGWWFVYLLFAICWFMLICWLDLDVCVSDVGLIC